MLSFFLILSLSTKKKDEIIEMDGHRFRKAVIHHDMYVTWLALLSTQDLPGHSEANNVFDEAFKIGKGFLKFAYLDTSKNANIQRRLKLDNKSPHYCVFYASGRKCIQTNVSARELINFASFYLPDLAEKASSEWLKKDESNSAAILFTDKKDTPLLWSAVSTAFHKSTFRIGISNDHEFAKQLGIDREFPVIVFHNYSHTIVYEGQNDFISLTANIKKFWRKKFSKVRPALIVKPTSEYKKLCEATDKVCIISNNDEDTAFDHLRKKYTTSMLEFLFGEVPSDVIEKVDGKYTIVFNQAGKYLEFNSITELEPIISEVVAGKISFPNMKEFNVDHNEHFIDDGL